MNDDFGTTLTALLDDVAGSIEPRADVEAVLTSQVPAPLTGVRTGTRTFRRGLVAAASLLVVGSGAVAAFHGVDSGPDAIATAPTSGRDEPAPATTHEVDRVTVPAKVPATSVTVATKATPTSESVATTKPADAIARTAMLGESHLSSTPAKQAFVGTAPHGETVEISTPYGSTTAVANDDGKWTATAILEGAPASATVVARITFSGGSEVVELTFTMPAVAEPEPQPVAFTVVAGSGDWAASPMKQTYFGTATPGSKILASTSFGNADAVANEAGKWELHLKMYEVPAGTGVRVVVTSSTSSDAFEFWLQRPVAPPPVAIGFTSNLGTGKLGATPMKQVLYGTGTPGSTVHAQSEYGSAEVTVSEKGKWEMVLLMHEVPAGTHVGVRVTNSASDAVFEYELVRPTSEPAPVDFTANAAFTECDSTPPFNEYWGRSTAGAVITITSPYGSTQVTSNADGKWEARLEFPDAPVGETFIVRITSTKGTAVYELPLTRVAPV